MMIIVDEISDAVADKAIQALDGLLKQTNSTEEWRQALFALLLTAAKSLRKAYGDEAWRVVLERQLSELDGTEPDHRAFH